MIRGIHGLFYSSEPDAARAFIRDKLKLPHTDVGGGWLIFDLPEGDLGVHPTDRQDQAVAGTHDISFYCDDIHETVASLKKRGVAFDEDITEAGFGRFTHFSIPGGVRVMLYEPKYVKSKKHAKTCGINRKRVTRKSERGSLGKTRRRS